MIVCVCANVLVVCCVGLCPTSCFINHTPNINAHWARARARTLVLAPCFSNVSPLMCKHCCVRLSLPFCFKDEEKWWKLDFVFKILLLLRTSVWKEFSILRTGFCLLFPFVSEKENNYEPHCSCTNLNVIYKGMERCFLSQKEKQTQHLKQKGEKVRKTSKES